ncbi:MAG: diguanylate cyclase [Magnetococcales bacterium]|nr:diguanylate cyclase [Magnetococcales bacterium]
MNRLLIGPLAALWHSTVLRSALLAAIALAILFPAFNHFSVLPRYQDLMIHFLEDEAVRTATHIGSYDFPIQDRINKASITREFVEEIALLAPDLKLVKVKVFSNDGEVVFSTDASDVGTINSHSYFHEQVAKGQRFTKLVVKEGRSMEGSKILKDVVEIYAPVMREGRFVGAFELYYDVTRKLAMLRETQRVSLIHTVLLTAFMLAIVLLILTRAGGEIAKRTLAQFHQEQSENRFRTIANSVQDALVEVDSRGEILLWNRSAQRMFGFSADEVVGESIEKRIMPERFRLSARQALERFHESGGGAHIGCTVELVGMKKDGSEFPLELSTSAVEMDGEWHALGTVRDITLRKEAEQKLKLGTNVIDQVLEGVIITDCKGLIEKVNPAFTDLTGFQREEAIGVKPNLLRSGRHDRTFYAEMWKSLLGNGYWQGEVWNRQKNGSLYLEWLSISAIKADNGEITNFVGVISDITQRKRNEERLEQLAFYDALTGIPNRMLFHERLKHDLNQVKRNKQQLAVFFLDLDYFKKVNDTYGHEVGDKLLQETARRLQNLLRKEDTVARLGGDEFAIILKRVTQAREDSELVASKVIQALVAPFEIDGNSCQVGTSIGIGIFPNDGNEESVLIKRADEAMYRAKEGGRNQFFFYS